MPGTKRKHHESVSKRAPCPTTPLLDRTNPNLAKIAPDYLYHIGFDTSMDLPAAFGDVRYVLLGGSGKRMRHIATRATKELDIAHVPYGFELHTVGKKERYSLFKVGPMLVVSHGMGQPSLLILLHEVAKLLCYAKVDPKEVVFIRTGTSGGLGLEPGTVVVSQGMLDAKLEPFFTQYVLGKEVKRPCTFDAQLAKSLLDANAEEKAFKVVGGLTMATNDFYEEQARVDGFFCDYTVQDQQAYLARARNKGVMNIEMEGTAMAAFTQRAGLRGAMVCCTLVDRLKGDQISSTPKQLEAFSDHTITAVFNWVRADMAARGADAS